MARHPDAFAFAADRRVKRLENELYGVRGDIVRLMPEEMSQLLTSYRSCNSRADYHTWERETVNRIASMAEPDPRMSYSKARGWCPLCRSGSSGPYEPGFSLPEGLIRHLLGTGNVHSCPVTDAAFNNARYSLRERFEAQRQADRAKLEERRKTERLFLIDPRRSPYLIDEHVWFREVRTAAEWEFAEKRLRELGFQTDVQGNVVAHKLIDGHRLILADPRTAGRIDFHIFNAERPTKRTLSGSFYLSDSWKNALLEKFKARLNAVCARWPDRAFR